MSYVFVSFDYSVAVVISIDCDICFTMSGCLAVCLVIIVCCSQNKSVYHCSCYSHFCLVALVYGKGLTLSGTFAPKMLVKISPHSAHFNSAFFLLTLMVCSLWHLGQFEWIWIILVVIQMEGLRGSVNFQVLLGW